MIAEDSEIKLLKTRRHFNGTPTTHLPKVQATMSLADLRDLARGPNFMQFHAVFGKLWPSRGNPGSTTDNEQEYHVEGSICSEVKFKQV